MNITHFTAAQFRVTGVGNLNLRLISLDDVQEKVMVPIVMSLKPRKYPVALVNFNQHRAQLEIKTTEIDESFHISEIILFIKPVASSYPQ